MVDELTALLEKVSRRYHVLKDLTDRLNSYGLSFNEEDDTPETDKEGDSGGAYILVKSSSDYITFEVRLDEANQEIGISIDAEDISEEDDQTIVRRCIGDYNNLIKALNETSLSKGLRIKEEGDFEENLISLSQIQEFSEELQESTIFLDLERILLGFGFEKFYEDPNRPTAEYKLDRSGVILETDFGSLYSVTVDARHRQLELYRELSPPKITKLMMEDLAGLKAALEAVIIFSEDLDMRLRDFSTSARFIYQSNIPQYKDPNQIELNFQRDAA